MFPWQTPGTAHGAGLFPHAAASRKRLRGGGAEPATAAGGGPGDG